MKKIIIIGLGNMGVAHLNSFINSKIEAQLYLIEKRISRHKNIKKILLKKKFNNFQLLNKSPKNKLFDFAIVATKSKDRLKAVEKLISSNKIRFLFLEKFLFNELVHYKKFNSIGRKKITKTFVNVWSNLFLNSLGIKKNKKKILIKVFLPENKLLTNLIHFYEIFRILVGEKFNIDLSYFNLKQKDKYYYDGTGKIILENKMGSQMVIKSKKMENNFIFNYKSCGFEKKVKISKGQIISLYNENKKKLPFPLASRVTNKFYKSLILNKKSGEKITFPKYSLIEKSSKIILNSLFYKYKKKIKIC